eukprot:s1626_g11.t1
MLDFNIRVLNIFESLGAVFLFYFLLITCSLVFKFSMSHLRAGQNEDGYSGLYHRLRVTYGLMLAPKRLGADVKRLVGASEPES